MKKPSHIIGVALTMTFVITACNDDDITSNTVNTENLIGFCSMVGQQPNTTRADVGLASGYVALPKGYQLSVQMKTKASDETVSNEGAPASYLVNTAGESVPSIINVTDGTNGLYWPSSTVNIGFEASGGVTDLNANYDDVNKIYTSDQTNAGNLISVDKISGYSGTDASHDAIQYLTAKQWKTINSSTTIPLYLKHDKAEITVKLVAGVGVSQTDLAYVANNTSLTDTIYSYDGTKEVRTLPFAEAAKVNGATENNTTQYTAIVEPYDYYTNDSKPITRICLNNQRYTFCSKNDADHSSTDETTIAKLKGIYNLEAGEHLTLTIKIGRDGREVLVSAVREDWKLVENKDIGTDDFGYAVQPYVISSADNLLSFLQTDKYNTQGNIAILSQDITLTAEQASTISGLTLNATLNLDGKTIYTPVTFLKDVSASGNLKYGVICITASDQSCAAVLSNHGTVEDITSSASAGMTLTDAGVVKTNDSKILNCINKATVTSTNSDIGGITATSSTNGMISGCVNNARVSTTNTATHLGGIVGSVDGGIVTNNTFAYGLTMSQTIGNSIIGYGTPATVSGNSWPTTVLDAAAGTNNYTNPYDGIIDSEDELNLAIDGGNTTPTNRYRIATDISLSSNWNSNDDKVFKAILEGNNKTITTNGTRIFKEIDGTFKNATIYLSSNLMSTDKTEGHTSASDNMSAVCLILKSGTMEGLTVKSASGVTIKAGNPSGVVGRAENATIKNCINKVSLIIYSATSTPETTTYAGGIVAEATNTVISGCGFNGLSVVRDENHKGKVYIGGIAGTLNKENKDVSLACTVTDCTDFYDFSDKTLSDKATTLSGGIAGLVGDKGAKNCVGNWWPTTIFANGAGYGELGVRNAIRPSEF